MTQLKAATRLTFLSALLAAGTLLTHIDIASAKGGSGHQQSSKGQSSKGQSSKGQDNKGQNNNGQNNIKPGKKIPQFVIQGQPVNVKYGLHKGKDKDKGKMADKNKNKCKNVTLPTPDCGPGAHDPVGHTDPGGKTAGGKTTGGAATFIPSSPNTQVTVSNGVVTKTITYGKGIQVTSNSPGTITVSNGTDSVTLPGGSISVHGSPSVGTTAGLQQVVLKNGDVGIGVSPILMTNPTKSGAPVPPGVTAADDAKFLGATVGAVGAFPAIGVAAVAMLPVATVVGVISGDVKGAIKDVGGFVEAAGDWVSGWF